jgi:hypothetical protein
VASVVCAWVVSSCRWGATSGRDLHTNEKEDFSICVELVELGELDLTLWIGLDSGLIGQEIQGKLGLLITRESS